MSMTIAAFRKQLPSADLKPACLIAGAEHLQVIEAADALRAREGTRLSRT
jgi:DNA polymerase III delta subunit